MNSSVYNRVMRELSHALHSATSTDQERALWEAISSLAAAYPALHRETEDE